MSDDDENQNITRRILLLMAIIGAAGVYCYYNRARPLLDLKKPVIVEQPTTPNESNKPIIDLKEPEIPASGSYKYLLYLFGANTAVIFGSLITLDSLNQYYVCIKLLIMIIKIGGSVRDLVNNPGTIEAIHFVRRNTPAGDINSQYVYQRGVNNQIGVQDANIDQNDVNEFGGDRNVINRGNDISPNEKPFENVKDEGYKISDPSNIVEKYRGEIIDLNDSARYARNLLRMYGLANLPITRHDYDLPNRGVIPFESGSQLAVDRDIQVIIEEQPAQFRPEYFQLLESLNRESPHPGATVYINQKSRTNYGFDTIKKELLTNISTENFNSYGYLESIVAQSYELLNTNNFDGGPIEIFIRISRILLNFDIYQELYIRGRIDEGGDRNTNEHARNLWRMMRGLRVDLENKYIKIRDIIEGLRDIFKIHSKIVYDTVASIPNMPELPQYSIFNATFTASASYYGINMIGVPFNTVLGLAITRYRALRTNPDFGRLLFQISNMSISDITQNMDRIKSLLSNFLKIKKKMNKK